MIFADWREVFVETKSSRNTCWFFRDRCHLKILVIRHCRYLLSSVAQDPEISYCQEKSLPLLVTFFENRFVRVEVCLAIACRRNIMGSAWSIGCAVCPLLDALFIDRRGKSLCCNGRLGTTLKDDSSGVQLLFRCQNDAVCSWHCSIVVGSGGGGGGGGGGDRERGSAAPRWE